MVQGYILLKNIIICRMSIRDRVMNICAKCDYLKIKGHKLCHCEYKCYCADNNKHGGCIYLLDLLDSSHVTKHHY
jgi:hypothetical protein